MPLAALPFSPEHYADWRRHSVEVYAAEKVAAGAWPAEGAAERSETELTSVLNAEQNTVGNSLRRVVFSDAPEPTVGWFWVGPATRDALPGTAWLYDIEIVPEHRGKGLGREVMALAEAETLRLGYTRLGLHVFGSNQVARRLYESCGYTLTDLNFAKDLEPPAGT